MGPSNYHLELSEYVHPRGEKTDVATNRPGAPHLAFVTDDIQGDYTRPSAAGVQLRAPAPVAIEEGVNRGGFSVYLLDPDDTTLEMLQPPAGRPWGSVSGIEMGGRDYEDGLRNRFSLGILKGLRQLYVTSSKPRTSIATSSQASIHS